MDKTEFYRLAHVAYDKCSDLATEVDITKSAVAAIERAMGESYPPSETEWDETNCLLIVLKHQMEYLFQMSRDTLKATFTVAGAISKEE